MYIKTMNKEDQGIFQVLALRSVTDVPVEYKAAEKPGRSASRTEGLASEGGKDPQEGLASEGGKDPQQGKRDELKCCVLDSFRFPHWKVLSWWDA